MDIKNLSNYSFTGIHLRKSKMNGLQKSISESISRAISYSDEYLEAGERGIDLYILPGKRIGSVNVRFMDTNSDFFIKEKDSSKILQEEVNDMTYKGKVEKVLEKLRKILDGSISKPKYNEEKIINGQTDLAKLRPDVYDAIFQESRTLLDVMDDRSAKLYAWEQMSLPDSNF